MPRWSVAAPIRKVQNPATAAGYVRTIKADIESYCGESPEYETRRVHGGEVCDEILEVAEGVRSSEYSYYVYLFAGHPVGMLVINEWPQPYSLGSLWIEYLVANPGTGDAGVTLVEYAVNLSEARNLRGFVALGAGYEDAEHFYGSLGFNPTGRMIAEDVGDEEPYRYPVMRLVPNVARAHWTKSRGKWVLRRMAGRQYYFT